MTRIIAWYDGACPLCRREIALMRRLDRDASIAFVDLTAAPADSCPARRDAMLARFHVEADGKLVTGAGAFAVLWRALPGLRPLGRVARNSVVLWALERLYRGFLRVRPRLQRLAYRMDAVAGPFKRAPGSHVG